MQEIWQYVVTFFAGGGGVVLLLVWAVKNPSTVEKWIAWFFRTFSWISKKLEYSNVSANLQSKVNSYGEKISKEIPELLPHAMKIVWVKDSSSVETSLRNGEIVVALDYSVNADRNLVVSTLAYLGKGLLPNARSYVEPTLMKATDFTVAKGVFISSGQPLATQYFFDTYISPEIKSNSQIVKDCQDLDLLQEKGYFTRLFLRQIKILGDKAYPSTPNTAVMQESREFFNFVCRIASKQRGVDVPGGLTFTGNKIRVNIMLVAKPETLARGGLRPFERRIALCRNMGIEYLYICGIGSNNIALAENIVEEQKRANSVMLLDSQRFRFTSDGKDFNAICILCRIRMDTPSTSSSDIDMILNVLGEYIQEIADGVIEVVYIVRRPGIKAKVIIHSADTRIDPLSICTDKTKLTAMRFSLGGENLEFIKWSDKPEELVVSSLIPLKPEQVLTSVFEMPTSVRLSVIDEYAKSLALGQGNINLKMASELTGYNIIVDVQH